MPSPSTDLVHAAYDEISDFEAELKQLVRERSFAVGSRSLPDSAGETRDRLLELSQEDIELELSTSLRAELLEHCLNAVARLHAAAKNDVGAEAARVGVVDALMDIEALRHILRDAIDHEPLRTLSSGKVVTLSRADAVREVSTALPRLTMDDYGQLLGIDARTVRRWKEQPHEPASRHAELAIELAAILRHSWTDEGVVRWFARSHPRLAGRKPADVLDDVEWEDKLREAALAGRAQTAT